MPNSIPEFPLATDAEPHATALSVSQVTFLLKEVMESAFPFVWVSGEISNCKQASSGHIYFTLKDEGAQLSAIMWRSAAQRLKFKLKDGLKVLAAGPIQLYETRGQYQLIAEQLEPQGVGALELAFRQLQQKLDAEGLFDPARKRPWPVFPRRIALITSPSSAAVRDMLQVITRRWPRANVVIVPVPVQGAEAAPQIADALRRVHLIPEVDVVICGRGGGSLEDLWAFNEEVVARAIFECQIPVISAVGHEIDLTIADLVADKRALTPSEAAELVVPLEAEVRKLLEQFRHRLTSTLQYRTQHAKFQVERIAQRPCLARPLDRIRELETQIDELDERMKELLQRRFESARHQLGAVAATLNALSPLAVLDRGYSLTKRLDDGSLIRDASQLKVGDKISTLFANASVVSEITEVDSD
ncbi:exodeoxyribonuclease VII large subunit [Schlesneria paludicola]|uniref:exodeoxyribonuclease VII large subunit n=1 Tax=Schlesneria paludicola TaxID=360056 RepID=UPI0002E43A53|nr:exodeoxyribonuclease VII large subunit [Schlesneria paludicola]